MVINRQFTWFHSLLLISMLASCGGGGDNNDVNGSPQSNNVAPTANAGEDQSVDEESTVTLIGNASDSDGTISLYSWTQIAGENVTFSASQEASTTFTAPTTKAQILLTFRLTVTDNDQGTATDTIDVIVNPVNVSPVANAGPTQVADEQTTVSLNGGGSDSDGSIESYTWTQLSGESVSLSSPNQQIATFQAPSTKTEASLSFQLTVTDDEGGTDSDTVNFIIQAVNTPPIAEAGEDQTIDEEGIGTLAGSGNDSDGTIESYSWTQISGESVTLNSPEQSVTTFEAPKTRVELPLSFELTVTDDEGGKATDIIDILINPINEVPSANAGADQTVIYPENILLDGSASSDNDGDNLTYSWNILSKPTGSQSQIDSPTFVKPSFMVDLDGAYTLQLIVNDGTIDSAPSTVTISKITIPIVTQRLELENGQINDNFGRSIDVFEDYVVVGATGTDLDSVRNTGSIYIYKKNIDEQYALVSAIQHDTNEVFGASVAISQGYVYVGAPAADIDETNRNSGAVYVYKNDGADNFNFVTTLIAADREPGDSFGTSLSASNNFLVVGAPSKNSGYNISFPSDGPVNSNGAAYVFSNNQDDTFTQVDILLKNGDGGTSSASRFGTSVSISNEYIVIGAPGSGAGSGAKGGAYIFKKSTVNNRFLFREELLTTNEDTNLAQNFGQSVSIFNNYLAVGEPTAVLFAGSSNVNFGSAYLYKIDENDAISIIDRISELNFTSGGSVAVNNNYLAISSSLGFTSGTRDTYLFEINDDNTLIEREYFQQFNAAESDISDHVVAMSQDALVISTQYQDGNAIDSGVVYIVDLNPPARPFFINHNAVYEYEEGESAILELYSSSRHGTTINYEIAGDDAFSFTADGNVLRPEFSLDFENPTDANFDNIYDINITLTDAINRSSTYASQIKVVDSVLLNNAIEILPSEPSQSGNFSTSFSKDIGYIAVGAPGNPSNNISPKVYIFNNNNEASIIENSARTFGLSTSLEENILAVGTSNEEVYIYQNEGGDNFLQAQRITSISNQTQENFGRKVLLDNGNLIISASRAQIGLTDLRGGGLYIYESTGGSYEYKHIIQPLDINENDNFGSTFSFDGDYLAVGATGVDASEVNQNTGAVYIFKPDINGDYVEVAKIAKNEFSTDSSFDSFGSEILLKNGYLFVKSTVTNSGGVPSILVFKNDGFDNFIQIEEIVKNFSVDSAFGSSIGFDGTYLAIGDRYPYVGLLSNEFFGSGEVTIYKKDNADNFMKMKTIESPNKKAYEQFGGTIMLDADGLYIGAIGQGGTNAVEGRIYKYDIVE